MYNNLKHKMLVHKKHISVAKKSSARVHSINSMSYIHYHVIESEQEIINNTVKTYC